MIGVDSSLFLSPGLPFPPLLLLHRLFHHGRQIEKSSAQPHELSTSPPSDGPGSLTVRKDVERHLLQDCDPNYRSPQVALCQCRHVDKTVLDRYWLADDRDCGKHFKSSRVVCVRLILHVNGGSLGHLRCQP